MHDINQEYLTHSEQPETIPGWVGAGGDAVVAQVDAACEFEVAGALMVIVVLLGLDVLLQVAIALDGVVEADEIGEGGADVEIGDSDDMEVLDEDEEEALGEVVDRGDVDVGELNDHVGQPKASEHGYVGEPYG